MFWEKTMKKDKKTRKDVLSVYDEAIINIDMFEEQLDKILEDNYTNERTIVSLYYAIRNFKMKLETILGKGTNNE
tara:strand:+ start:791 stop:1015 length:225 start_codon:yes stop_codon:yes gene_type:complete